MCFHIILLIFKMTVEVTEFNIMHKCHSITNIKIYKRIPQLTLQIYDLENEDQGHEVGLKHL